MEAGGRDTSGRLAPDADTPAVVAFDPAQGRRDVPAEVFTVESLRLRIPPDVVGKWERLDLHFLLLCTDGAVSWGVDFGSQSIAAGSLLRLRPGQLVRHPPLDGVAGLVAVWPVERHPDGIDPPSWWSELDAPAQTLPDQTAARIGRWLQELRDEQGRFDGSATRSDLMTSMLRVVLLEASQHWETHRSSVPLPQPYIDLRNALAATVFERPTVASLARSIGYSTRTLDRACHAVSRQSAKQVIDERVGLELRRMLADERTPITEVRLAFGFAEASNFTKFVRRVTGRSPSEFRDRPA